MSRFMLDPAVQFPTAGPSGSAAPLGSDARAHAVLPATAACGTSRRRRRDTSGRGHGRTMLHGSQVGSVRWRASGMLRGARSNAPVTRAGHGGHAVDRRSHSLPCIEPTKRRAGHRRAATRAVGIALSATAASQTTALLDSVSQGLGRTARRARERAEWHRPLASVAHTDSESPAEG